MLIVNSTLDYRAMITGLAIAVASIAVFTWNPFLSRTRSPMSTSEIENAWIGKYCMTKRPQTLRPADPSQRLNAREGAAGEIARMAAFIVPNKASYGSHRGMKKEPHKTELCKLTDRESLSHSSCCSFRQSRVAFRPPSSVAPTKSQKRT